MSTWWIDQPTLLGSSNPSDEDLSDLRRQGFTVLISLLHDKKERSNYDVKGLARAGWSRHSIPVEDFSPPALAQLHSFVAIVGSAEPATKLVVHCQGGSGRTGTMAAAYWVSNGLSATAAIARVRDARPGAIETCEQELSLYKFADEVAADAKKGSA